ncbi:MAG: flavodoxin [Hyphomicrobiales bacterium]|nr:flavodoxin [Hyphomicrobiales bacterium]MCP4998669.1 flavodoxin [Hyphomicrobiales bacterium]
MNKVLVTHYSLTGNTRRIAEAVAAKCDADIEAIQDLKPRTGFWGYCRSAMEAIRGREAAIQPAKHNPESYDLVVLGTPVWVGKPSSPMRSYIGEQSGRFKRVAFFCCQGGSGAEKVFQQMADLCGRQPVATLIVKDSDIKSGTFHPLVDEFTGELNLAKRKPKPAA